MKKIFRSLIFTLALCLCMASSDAYAGDGATLVFNSGIRAYINNGYTKIADAVSKLNGSSKDHMVVQLDLEGAPFLVDVAKIVIVCRDQCTSLQVVDVRDPARGRGGDR